MDLLLLLAIAIAWRARQGQKAPPCGCQGDGSLLLATEFSDRNLNGVNDRDEHPCGCGG